MFCRRSFVGFGSEQESQRKEKEGKISPRGGGMIERGNCFSHLGRFLSCDHCGYF